MPARGSLDLDHGPVVLPEDPTGIAEPHDILAAEEFAMPAGRPVSRTRSSLRAARSPLGLLRGRGRRSPCVMPCGGALARLAGRAFDAAVCAEL